MQANAKTKSKTDGIKSKFGQEVGIWLQIEGEEDGGLFIDDFKSKRLQLDHQRH